MHVAGPLIFTQRGQVEGEIVGRAQRVGVVVAKYAPVQLVSTFEQRAGGSGLTPGLEIRRGTVEQPWDVTAARVGVAGVAAPRYDSQTPSAALLA